jgi:hypothetical protein
MSLKIIAIVATIKIFMSVRHVTVVANAVLYSLQLTAKIIATTLRNRTNLINVLISLLKCLFLKLGEINW